MPWRHLHFLRYPEAEHDHWNRPCHTKYTSQDQASKRSATRNEGDYFPRNTCIIQGLPKIRAAARRPSNNLPDNMRRAAAPPSKFQEPPRRLQSSWAHSVVRSGQHRAARDIAESVSVQKPGVPLLRDVRAPHASSHSYAQVPAARQRVRSFLRSPAWTWIKARTRPGPTHATGGARISF